MDKKLVGSIRQKAKHGKMQMAKDARLALENKTGKSVVTRENFLTPAKEKKKLK